MVTQEESIGIQKKIIELDPYKASVEETVVVDGETGKETVVGQETVFEPDTEPDSNAGWVPVTVKQGGRTRYTVRLPYPVAGDGLAQETDGNLRVDVDPLTMEILPDGKLASRAAIPSGIVFSSRIPRVTTDFQVLGLDNVVAKDKVLDSGDADRYVNEQAPGKGEVDFPASCKWIKVDALLHLSVAEYERSIWVYRFVYRVEVSGQAEPIDIEFTLDTTGPDTIISLPVSIKHSDYEPVRVKASIKWVKEDGDDSTLAVECNAKMSMTAV